MSYKASAAVSEDSDATANARLVAFVLAEAVHLEDASCYLGTDTIADRAKCSRNTVTAAYKRLAEIGELRVWLRAVRRPGGAVNLYQLVLPGLPCEKPPPLADGRLPDLGPGFAQELGEASSPKRDAGLPNSEGGSHNQAVREPSNEPSIEPSTSEPPAREVVHRLPEHLPEHLHEDAIAAGRILYRAARARKQKKAVLLEAVGSAVAQHPEKDHVEVAGRIEHWLCWGNGQGKPCRDIVQRFRDWLPDSTDVRLPDGSPLATPSPAQGVVSINRGRRLSNSETVDDRVLRLRSGLDTLGG